MGTRSLPLERSRRLGRSLERYILLIVVSLRVIFENFTIVISIVLFIYLSIENAVVKIDY